MAKGNATFASPEIERSVQPGDAIFVKRNTPHKFTGMSEYFAVWAVIYGDAQ